MRELEGAIVATVRYFDLFDQPVTPVQIWRTLIVDSHDSSVRWAGQRLWSLTEVVAALQTSPVVRERLGTKWGYYFLEGRDDLVIKRLARHRIAQAKWDITERIARVLRLVPFVRMVALSGSLAAGNTHERSDLDVLVVARAGRIWLARLGLLLATQLLGRRRTHWEREAPDKVCLNHYVTDDALVLSPAVHNVYGAVLYRALIPLYGQAVFERFQQANAPWIMKFLMYPVTVALPPVLALSERGVLVRFKHLVEMILAEPVFDWLEVFSERLQRRSIMRHTQPGQSGRVVLSATELAFHPNTKVPGLLARFYQEEGQQSLL